MSSPALPSAPLAGLRVVELTPDWEPALQRFFDANPLYFETVAGAPAPPGEAHGEIHGALPAGWPHTRKWLVGYADDRGDLAAMATVVSDLLAHGVWHVGLFIVATARHGTGDARALYRSLENWVRGNGGEWMRLGVVGGNARAERFWEREGYVEVRRRDRIAMGTRANTVRVMVKPLCGGSVRDYLARVERDRPGAA